MSDPITDPAFDVSRCSGVAGGCRWCQVWGALAFGEPMPPLTMQPQSGEPSTEDAQVEAPSGPLQRLLPDKHPLAPQWWIGVEVPDYPIGERRFDQDFLTAKRHSVRLPPKENVLECFKVEKLDSQPFIESGRIDFRFWSDFCFDPIWPAVCVISCQPFVKSAYLGTTSSSPWRWSRCDGYNNMIPHKDRFRRMYPLCCSWGANVLAMERLIQSKMLKHFKPVCAFCDAWRPGPLPTSRVCVMHLCVELKGSHINAF